MDLTLRKAKIPNPQSWQPTADDAPDVRRSLDATRERLRVARQRAADRQRLAENALAAGQEAFEASLRDAADAHAETARVLEDTVVHLERCWSRIEMEQRRREREAMQAHATAMTASAERAWWEAD